MSNSPVQGVTNHLIFAIAAGAIGSSFQHGYNTGVLNTPESKITDFINTTYTNRFGEDPGESFITNVFSLMTSIFCVGGMLGALATATIAQKFGRKGGLLLNNVFVFIGVLFMAFAKPFSSWELLIIGRFFIGINSGKFTDNEFSSPHFPLYFSSNKQKRMNSINIE